ncbi:hypothetical protein HU759_018225 [Pseudomonas sp. OE 28.3]|uniref:DUF6602 domain-containing protein n=1 Tax=Pseudomonas sp. OE 28.3 TaxID=2745519 RepID=UPI001646C3D1|nr:DUF6602 domain-containing protein [Pseudomonas sp. OE 28.3]QXI57043.1 hypothetical protein HU759_018225 [Pseudomonas sp. OE 28.3]
MALFEKLFRAKIQELRTMFLATGGLDHNGEKGSFRETFVKELIQLFLPIQFGVGSGVIIDLWGRQSPQVDLLIYDRRTMPPILETDGRGIYPFDSVLRVLEVKSSLDDRGLKQFSELLWRLSPKNPHGLKMSQVGNLENGKMFYPLCCLFGFGSKLKTLPERCRADKNISISSNMVFVDGVGLFNPSFPAFMTFEDYDFGVSMFIGWLLETIVETANSRAEYNPQPWLLTIGNLGETSR